MKAHFQPWRIQLQSIKDYLGEHNLQRFLNHVLRYLSGVELPLKRGTFVEYRTGLLNISPVGRNVNQEEREAFYHYDMQHNVRKHMVEDLEKNFADLNLKYSIGGQISFDVFPIGWDKTYCLRHIADKGFAVTHFFGDKTREGENDFEIYTHPAVKGHSVKSWKDTIAQCKELFF